MRRWLYSNESPEILVQTRLFCQYDSSRRKPVKVAWDLSTGSKRRSLNATTNMLKSRSTVHKPGRLKRGGRIGVLATAGIVEPKSLEAGIAAIRAEGFGVELSKRIFDGTG